MVVLGAAVDVKVVVVVVMVVVLLIRAAVH